MASIAENNRKSPAEEVTPGKEHKRPEGADAEELMGLNAAVTHEDVLIADRILQDKLAIKPTPLKVHSNGDTDSYVLAIALCVNLCRNHSSCRMILA